MNRLWVRLALVISALILVFSLLPLVSFLIFALTHEPPAAGAVSAAADAVAAAAPAIPRSPWSRIPEELLRAFVFAGIAGVIGGVVVSRVLAAPIDQLAKAARAIGRGDLTTRVEIPKHSQEIDDLAGSFNRMAADLEHAAELRTTLMADVSHELRTPLTVLEGNLRAALDHVYELDDEQIANLYQQTRLLIRLVNDLRELSLAEAAELPLYLQPLDLDQLVQETAAVFGPLAEEKAVALTTTVQPGLPPVAADSVRIRQVLHNLLDNALRHTPDGGRIAVCVGQANPGEVTIAVEDSGDGMQPQQLEQVFNRFYRTDPARSRETGGSGLGLAIVKAIVEAHGGSIAASSPGLGQGSMFTLHLPV